MYRSFTYNKYTGFPTINPGENFISAPKSASIGSHRHANHNGPNVGLEISIATGLFITEVGTFIEATKTFNLIVNYARKSIPK